MASPLSLIFDIIARDRDASRTLRNVGDAAEHAGQRGERFGSLMKGGMLAAAGAVAAAGAAFGGFMAVSVKSLARIEEINAQTETVIKSMGGAAGVTAKHVEDLAGELENLTASEAETIQKGANLLLTFGNIKNAAGEGNDVFDQTTRLMVDMARAMGTDADAAAIQLGKALNDPIKGITALTRVGVSFTEEQKELIRTLTESGDIMGAQKVILGELERQFGGSAEAFAQTTQGKIELAKHAIGTLGETMAEAALPVLGDLAKASADWLNQTAEDFAAGEGWAGRFARSLEDIRSALATTKDAAVQLFDVLFKGDFKGGPLSEDSAIVDKAFDLRDAAVSLRDWWRDEALPALEKVNAFLVETFRPTFEELAKTTREDFIPAFKSLQKTFEENRPAIEAVLSVLGFLAATFGMLRLKMLGDLLPPLIDFAGFMTRIFAANVAAANEVLKMMGGWFESLAGWASKAYAKVEEFADVLGKQKVPGWIKDLAGFVERIAGGLGGAAGKVAGFFGMGDGPGRAASFTPRGGNTLAAVKSILPAGAMVTSTYRSPAQNAAVGGIPGSYHTDAKNPAVDIAGSRAVMDEVYARLSMMGNWRELLYKTPGHWDHVHVAHQGGEVSATWPSMPGWGVNERPVRAEVGERIYAKGEQPAADVSGLAQALTGMTFVLEIDGQPVRAIARAEAVGAIRVAARR